MSKPRNLLVFSFVCAALAACTEAPTLTPAVQAPASPAFNGGHMLGSGGRAAGADSTTAAVSTETTAGDGTTAARGGHMLGSGG